jgi:hypothetical protein
VIYVQGRGWRYEREWPIARTENQSVHLEHGESGAGTLDSTPPAASGEMSYTGDPTVGVTAGLWDPTGTGVGLPMEQTPDDLRSLAFTGEPIPSDLEITGSPQATLYLAVDTADEAHIVVKLCDVAPDGRSSLITTGWARAGHRPVGELHVPLWATSYVVPAGHRLRVSVSCSDFPRIWPTRTNPKLRVATGARTPSAVSLPTVPPADLPQLKLPVPDPSVKRTPHDIEGVPRWQIIREPAKGAVSVTTGIRNAIGTPAGDGRFEIDRVGRATVTAGRPDSARVEGEATIRLETPQGAHVTVQSRLRVTQNGQDYHASVTVDGQKIFERDWSSGLSEGVAAQVGEPVHDGGGGRVQIRER